MASRVEEDAVLSCDRKERVNTTANHAGRIYETVRPLSFCQFFSGIWSWSRTVPKALWEWLYHISNWDWMIGIFWSLLLAPRNEQSSLVSVGL